ncbi:MAG: trypsin-like peptidase domain-containing protein [Candidatus Blackburnbacteria bacterium]|nr:trypsin-like peptidase domain-containing protein [Candidatus Blackburnbacteria bacterium]
MKLQIRKFVVGVAGAVVVTAILLGGAAADRVFNIKPLDKLFPREGLPQGVIERQVIKEESTVIDVAEKVSPSVVTITVQTPKRRVLELSPFGGLGFREQGGDEQDLATGFIVSPDGLIVTNKHVVSESGVKYKVVTKDDKEFEVTKTYRDPVNDLALLKISASGLPTVVLGDSDKLKVGQFVIAIGTALGEFRHTVTTGVISGLGRGITAGSPFEGFVERLDNVIQTDAAINPGNSGGPLLDSSGRAIGVNVAVAQGAQNIGFAIPINVLKASIDQFQKTGEFSRPFFGVQYQIISKEAALLNEVPEGAYVRDVISGSAADKAGIKVNDIITKFGGEKIEQDKGGLAVLVNKHKVGDKVDIEIWRDEKTLTLSATLTEAPEQ